LPPDKGSFAPSPEKIEMMEKFDNEKSNDKDVMMKKSIKFHNRVMSNEFHSESPDFT
jgi:hypothetical protein